MSNWIKLNRKIRSHWLWPTQSRRKFTKCEAWLDLIMMAAYEAYDYQIYNKPYTIARGCLPTSAISLGKRWKWDRRTVSKFLDALKEENMISCSNVVQNAHQTCTILKINNYDTFQPLGQKFLPTTATTSSTTNTPLIKKNVRNKKNLYSESEKKKGLLENAK